MRKLVLKYFYKNNINGINSRMKDKMYQYKM